MSDIQKIQNRLRVAESWGNNTKREDNTDNMYFFPAVLRDDFE